MQDFRTFLIEEQEKKKIKDDPRLNPKGEPFRILPIHGAHATEKKVLPQKSNLKEYYTPNPDHENEHLGADVETVHKNLHRKMPLGIHEDHHLKEFEVYSRNSRNLNKHLVEAHSKGLEPHNNIRSDFDTDEELHAAGVTPDTKHFHNLKRLDDAVGLQKLDSDLHVYSGIARNPMDAVNKNEHKRIFLPGFTSSSIDPEVAKRYASQTKRSRDAGQHIMKIHLRPGQAGAYIGEHGYEGDEKEFLLPRGLTLQHVKSEKKDGFNIHHFNVSDGKKPQINN